MARFGKIKSGKYRGWRGWANPSDDKGYFDIGISHKETRKGTVKGSDVGLGEVMWVKKKNIKWLE